MTEESGPCTEGYYCPGGQDTFTPAEYQCPQGFYCPTGSDEPLICDRGEQCCDINMLHLYAPGNHSGNNHDLFQERMHQMMAWLYVMTVQQALIVTIMN